MSKADGIRMRTAATSGWAKANRRRGELIHRLEGDGLSPRETQELERLQRVADLRTDLRDPFVDLMANAKRPEAT